MRNIFLAVFILLATALSAQKNYIWLHGLEGNQGRNAWDIYRYTFTQKNGITLRYSSANSIPGIAGILYNDHLKTLEKTNSYVLIGHSMGGLVARSLQKLSSKVTGIVTVGTPHNGSNLVKNTVNGKTYNLFENVISLGNDAFDASTAGILLASLPVSAIAFPVIAPITAYKNKIINIALPAIKTTLDLSLNAYKLTHGSIRDLMPGSNYLKQMNGSKINVPLINIYCAEESQQVFRMLGSFFRSDDGNNILNIDKSFDEEYLDDIRSAVSFLAQIQTAHDVVYKTLAYPAVAMPWIWATRELVLQARYKWDELKKYVETDLHNGLLTNMNAFEYKLTTFYVYNSVTSAQTSTYTKYVPYLLENDGVVNRKEVQLDPSAGDAIYNVRVPQVNHSEVGNHIEMRKMMNNILVKGNYGKAFTN